MSTFELANSDATTFIPFSDRKIFLTSLVRKYGFTMSRSQIVTRSPSAFFLQRKI
ncbi:MAG: hypothetical protein L6V93_18955 [Clostridiales bacterium]|nr:MAG: hypothetical protein L6V93_18955 [Clostridiales bacterium]